MEQKRVLSMIGAALLLSQSASAEETCNLIKKAAEKVS